MTIPQFDVLFVGAGVASMATAIRLLQFTNKPLSIAIVEKDLSLRYGGLAYAAKGNSWTHIFNIQAGRMSIFREDVEDFLIWTNKEADRSHWPQKWKNMIFHVSGPAPRRIYADYIKDRFQHALSESISGCSVSMYSAEVTKIERKEEHFEVELNSSQLDGNTPNKVFTKRAIVGTGNLLSHFPFTKEIEGHPRFIRRQYMPEGFDAIKQIPQNAEVAIIGSSLSAYDSIISLREDLGHKGKITLFSRTGLTPLKYPENHLHQVIDVRKPPFIDEPYQGREQLVKDIIKEWQYLNNTIRQQAPNIQVSIIPERITKAWEAYFAELVNKVPAKDTEYLLNKYNSVIATMRVAAMPLATNFVEPLEKHNIELIEAEILTTKPKGNENIEITYLNKSLNKQQTVCFGAVISNLNREINYQHIEQPLWRNLIDVQGYATPHKQTNRGIEVSEFGEFINNDNQITKDLYAVGIPREGDEIARNGRQGAFAYNVATIKNHSISVAIKVLADINKLDLELDYSLSQEQLLLLEQAVGVRVHWLSSRKREEKRNVLPTALETVEFLAEALKEDSLPLNDARNLALTLVEKLALQKMTDVSVTPKQLRENLGLNKRRTRKKAS
ncbi:FAD/NAD(P)-binding protein [Shewanella sp. 202IG2-18]|uniref:FAD/NAD(P)-binding protein n=1 Tax=Parashewanella hymeniacidonis TaxID=2807618 RepID=UPI0019620C5B|nr:FAD/NAD(P)-binding protein [Parashewanella hymeniacidonis]MBM7072149.1 FAD/NAD(P)-binding protein [Parashewanella hymeniacidonis]